MIVKVCGITRREDAEVAVEAGASAIGFIFYKPSPRYVTPEKARELGDSLNVWKVGVFVDESPTDIEAVMRAANLDVAQIYGDTSVLSFRVWHAVRIQSESSARQGGGQHPAEALFLDSSGNGLSFNWALARNAAPKVIIAGGLDASNVREAIRIAQPWGVDASSRLEISPGIKDHEKMWRFIESAREIS
jgi:phosphoribosylanthranilate isomerase